MVNAIPLTEKNQVNEQEYRRHIRWLASKGVGFLQPVAATGQAVQTTEDEYRRILEITVDEIRRYFSACCL